VYGRSFARAAETENFALGYSRQGDEPVAVGVLHANVGGNTDYDPYAPASPADLRAAGLDYWALGHIHKQEILSRDPWVAYAGSPQGLNPKETGAHGCFVVKAGRSGITSVEAVETASVVWAQLEVDASEADGIEDVRRLLVEACSAASLEAERACVARIRLVGRSAAHANLSRAGLLTELGEDLRAEQAARAPWLWIDRLEDRTSRILDVGALREGADFAGELVRSSDDLMTDPVVLANLIAALSAPVSTTLSCYVLGLSDAELLERARDAALDLLVPEGGDAR
jgi:DNA repair exonuclease SbcCD nuclease subunit